VWLSSQEGWGPSRLPYQSAAERPAALKIRRPSHPDLYRAAAQHNAFGARRIPPRQMNVRATSSVLTRPSAVPVDYPRRSTNAVTGGPALGV